MGGAEEECRGAEGGSWEGADQAWMRVLAFQVQGRQQRLVPLLVMGMEGSDLQVGMAQAAMVTSCAIK